MIQIIKRGEKYNKKYMKKCRNCKTIFTYQSQDRKLMSFEPINYGVLCPVCKEYQITSIFDRRAK